MLTPWQRIARAPPLSFVAVGLAAGDAAAGRWPMPYGIGSLVVAALGGAILWRTGPPWRRLAVLLLAAIYGALLADGVYRPVLSPQHLVHFAGRRPLSIEATLQSEPIVRGGRAALLVDAERVDAGKGWRPGVGRIRVSLGHLGRDWQSGDRVRLRTRLRRPRNFGTPGEFDYAAYLARRRVYVTGYIDDDASIALLAPAAARPGDVLRRWRQRVAALIDASLERPAAGVLRALVIGREDGITPEQRRAFTRAGVSHVLSISGLHVGLVATAAYGTFRWLLCRSEWLLLAINVPKLAVALSVAPVLLYAGIAGTNVATTRAVAMILLFLGAVLVDRRRHLMVSLAAAAVGILIAAPGSALDISFQLSFVAVAALALATRRFWGWWPGFAETRLLRLRSVWYGRLAKPLLLSAVVSLSALAATTPLTALHFNQVSPLAPLANLVVVPVLGSAAVVLGLLAAFCEPLTHAAAVVLVQLAGICVRLGTWLVDGIAALPGAALRVPTPTLAETVLAYALLLSWLCLPGRTRRVVVAALLVVGGSMLTWRYGAPAGSADLRVAFLSIGQGDATVVEMPDGTVLIVDGGGIGGGTFDVGERVLAPFLWSRGITRVDVLALTHPQFDHYGGLRFVVENFAPREIWTSGRSADGKRYAELVAALRIQAVAEVALRYGDQRRFGTVGVRVLSPVQPGARNPNDDSLVLQLTYAGVRVLLSGDIEAAAEAELVSREGELQAAVLKVPHHGSRTSSTAAFVTAVAPRLAVISAGADNRFGFPHPEVVRRYLAQRSFVARTDFDGAVEVGIDARGQLWAARYGRDGGRISLAPAPPRDAPARQTLVRRSLGATHMSVDSPSDGR